MDSLDGDWWLTDLLAQLSAAPTIELYLLLNESRPPTGIARVRAKLRQVGLLRLISIAAFNTFEKLEQRVFSAFSSDIREFFRSTRVNPAIFAGEVILHPEFSRSRVFVTYPAEAVDAIKALELDLILRGNGTGIYKGQILRAARHGIISFHHGDNRWNRGGPPGFWEVYLKNAASGFVIQILNEFLDGGDVIFRGEAWTKRSYTENLVNLIRVANPFMAKVIIGFSETGKLPPVEPRMPYSETLFKTPKFSITARHVLRMFVFYVSLAIRRKVLRREMRWWVAFVRSDWRDANLSRATVIQNPPGRFLADPFVVTRGGETAIFVEDYHYSNARGVISAVRLLPDGSHELVPNVVAEQFHLSFPYPFEYEDQLYMIPETDESRSIRLYRCTRFPDKWVYVKDLMSGLRVVDSMLFEHEGRWWLLCNIPPLGTEEHGAPLHAFSAHSPLSSEWRPHAGNPVQFSVTTGRNGGLLRDSAGGLFRVRQRQAFNEYGAAVSIAKIVRLTDTEYKEESHGKVRPNFMRNLRGTHHMHSNGAITVLDFLREESVR